MLSSFNLSIIWHQFLNCHTKFLQHRKAYTAASRLPVQRKMHPDLQCNDTAGPHMGQAEGCAYLEPLVACAASSTTLTRICKKSTDEWC